MGRVTYYDPVIAIAKELGKVIEELSIVNSVRVAPYIRSGTVTGNYRFSDSMELTVTGFWGMDGVGVSYLNSSRTNDLESKSSMEFDWTNYQGFINSGFLWNPRNDMLLKFTAGAGFEESILDGDMRFNIYNKSFLQTPANDRYYTYISGLFNDPYDFYTKTFYKQTDSSFNLQGRVDFDWELGNRLLFAAGFQEMFTHYKSKGNQQVNVEKNMSDFDSATQEKLFIDMGVTDNPPLMSFLRNYLIVSVPLNYNPDVKNILFTTSGYGLIEYQTPDNRIKTELGIRIDHFYMSGNGFSLQSTPAINPRLNLDFNIFKDFGIVQSFDITAGTGLFSSMNSSVFIAEKKYEISEIKPNRSWTSVLGTRLEFSGGIILNIEGYYKYIFDRMYIPVSAGLEGIDVRPQFNGEGKAWGIDLMLQKLQSRWWDGWMSYSFSWANYRDPDGGNADMGISGGIRDGWYFPSYHRFHNLNLVLNIKPTPRINIYTRFGLASGVQLSRRTTNEPYSYPVYMYDPDDPQNNKFIEVYYWPARRDENNRTTASLPMDIKLSIFGSNANGKTRYEVYAAVENVLALLYTSQGNTSFNRYTGQIDTGSNTASYEIPIPIPSFGFKISY